MAGQQVTIRLRNRATGVLSPPVVLDYTVVDGFSHGAQITKAAIGARGPLTDVPGFTTTTDGTVYRTLRIHGGITIHHHTTFDNCEIIGSPTAGSAGYTVKHTAGLGKLVQLLNCTLVTRSAATKGLTMYGDAGLYAYRTVFRGGTDNAFLKPEGIHVEGYGAVLRECWLGDLQNSPGSHRDCLQIHGPAPSGALIERCRLAAFNIPTGADPLTAEADGTSLGSAALILTGDGGIDRVHVRDSVAAGGNYTMDLRGAGATNTALAGCRFGLAHRYGPLLANTSLLKSGNTWAATGATVCCGPVQEGQPIP